MIKWDRTGVTREVFLTKNYAFKIPKLTYGWKNFLHGLLCNMNERMFGTIGWPELCPVVFSIPGGWLVVMPRVRLLTEKQFNDFDVDLFCDGNPNYALPIEKKHSSFGWLNGVVVGIDYGSP